MSLSLEKAKQLINDPSLTDPEIAQIIDACQLLTEILFEKWLTDSKNNAPKKTLITINHAKL